MRGYLEPVLRNAMDEISLDSYPRPDDPVEGGVAFGRVIRRGRDECFPSAKFRSRVGFNDIHVLAKCPIVLSVSAARAAPRS